MNGTTAPDPEVTILRRELRFWRSAAVGVLVVLTAGLATVGWYHSKTRRAARTVTLKDGTAFRLVDTAGNTRDFSYTTVKGVLVKTTVTRDHSGRKLREEQSLEDEWNARLMTGR